jgi:hypothetical protein
LEREKARMCAEIDILIGKNPEYAKSLLEDIRQQLLENIRPIRFNENNPESVMHQRSESFEKLCFKLRQSGIHYPESMSTYSFYKSLELLSTKKEH